MKGDRPLDGCIFCKIIAGEIPCTKVFENDKILAFRDIDPQAPVHVLIVPKRHVANILELSELRNGLMANVVEAVTQIARAEGVDKSGFRLVSNCGPDARQSVDHVHPYPRAGGEQAWASPEPVSGMRQGDLPRSRSIGEQAAGTETVVDGVAAIRQTSAGDVKTGDVVTRRRVDGAGSTC